MARLNNKRIIITGAGSGIGRATAELAAAEGACVVAVDLADSVQDTAATITNSGGKAVAVVADAGSEADVQGYVQTCVD